MGSVKGQDLLLLILCFQLGLTGHQLLFEQEDVRLLNKIHQYKSKREFVGSSLRNEVTPSMKLSMSSANATRTKAPTIARKVQAEVVKTMVSSENQPQESVKEPRKRLNREQKRVKRLKQQQQFLIQKLGNATLHSASSNYYQLAQNLYPGFPLVPELLPLKIMTKFVQENSQRRLEELWVGCHNTSEKCVALQQLKFVVGHYSCPLEAGNRLHKFMNALIWAITTKRVFLWKYFDEATCREEAAELATGTCDSFLNTPEDCERILQLADWVPSWDEWSVKLNLSPPIRACAIGTRDHDIYAMPMDGDHNPKTLRIGQQVNLETGVIVGNPNNLYAKRLLAKKSSQVTALQLFKQGYYFTYGMLLEALFTLHPSLFQELGNTDGDADTYFIHARHPPSRSDARNIDLELMCMERLLVGRPNPQKPCFVVTMTDREETRPLLEATLQENYGCTPLSSNTSHGIARFRPEHGAFAGRGYFQDIALAIQTRTGFMAPHLALRKGIGIRTSSALPRELVEFRRVLESPDWDSVREYQECVGTHTTLEEEGEKPTHS